MWIMFENIFYLMKRTLKKVLKEVLGRMLSYENNWKIVKKTRQK